MRDDLEAAYRALGLRHRCVFREYLGRLESLLGPAETVRVLTPGRWRAQRCLVVVTTSRLVLLHRPRKCFSMHQLTFWWQRITHFGVPATHPERGRFRLAAGLDPEEFSAARGVDALERNLREAVA